MKDLIPVISPANSETSLVDYCHFYCDSRCCKSVFLLPEEYKILKDNKLIEENDPDILDMGDYYILIENQNTGKCRFLKNNLCTIQEFKPIDCKIWPLYFNPNSTETDFLCYDSNCPIAHRLPNRFIGAALFEMEKIPIALKKEFFDITIKLGYKLNTRFNIDRNTKGFEIIFKDTAPIFVSI